MKLIKLCTVFAALILATQAYSSTTYPDKPIKIVIGFPAGGPLDQHARLLVDKLQTILGQPVLVDYKPGAGGSVGAESVAKSPADGYTLMLANTGVSVINGALYSKLPYNTLRDFVPIARTAQQPLALLVNNAVPAKTLPEFIAYTRKNPGKSTMDQRATAGFRTSCLKCSKPPLACSWCIFPTVAVHLLLPI